MDAFGDPGYPDGSPIDYEYGAAGSSDDEASRLTGIEHNGVADAGI